MAEPEPPFEERIGYLLANLGAAANRRWREALRGASVTPVQHAMLLVLGVHGPLMQRDLGTAIKVGKRDLQAVVDRAVERGLVERQLDPGDRRRRMIGLTRAGTATARRLALAADGIEAEFLKGLSEMEQQRLQSLLLRLTWSLSETDDQPADDDQPVDQ